MNVELRGKSVLLVDDEDQVRKAVGLMLVFLGLEVREAKSGLEALELYRLSKFDYVVTDYNMPAMRGDALARAIKAINPEQRVVMLTGFVGAVLIDGQLPATIDYLVEKPCRALTLATALDGIGRPEAEPPSTLNKAQFVGGESRGR